VFNGQPSGWPFFSLDFLGEELREPAALSDLPLG
jgi:hypothetical protein